MPRQIVIEEDAGAAPPAPPADKIDVQDGLLAAGIAFAETAAGVIWWPAALILAAIFCLGFALLIELSKRSAKR